MKVVKEPLLLNDLASTLDSASEEALLIMRESKAPVMMMSLETYNELKAKAYKSE